MSGLCGIVDLAERAVAADDLEPMLAAAPYRSHHGAAVWTGGCAAIAVLAGAAHGPSPLEPIWRDAATGTVVVADARVHDRSALITALPATVARRANAGSPPTDTELIAAAWRAWGTDGLGRLLGDFVVAIWEPSRRRFHAARDAMGMRSLAYRIAGTRVWFASEVQMVLAAPGVSTSLFEPALVAHLLGRFAEQRWTPFDGVRRLPAGHVLSASSDGHRLERFWSIDPHRRIRFRREEAYAEAFRALFENVVRDRIEGASDVAVLLSGGLDSGAVASMAGRLAPSTGLAPERIRAYAWRSDELPEVDERQISDHIVAAFGMTPRSVNADDALPLSDGPGLGLDANGPYVGVYGALLGRALRSAAEDGVQVVLSGGRGDLVAGEDVLDTPGLLLHGQLPAVLAELRAYRRWRRCSYLSAAAALLLRPALADLARLARRAQARRVGRPRPSRRPAPPWVRRDALERVGADAWSGTGTEPPADLHGVARRRRHDMLFLDMSMETTTWLERLHARAGVVFADPWSDRRLAEFALALPPSVVQRMAAPKRLVREAMRDVMPEAARQAARKTSPEPLYGRALRSDPGAVVERLLSDPVSARLGLVEPEALRHEHAKARDGRAPMTEFWWALTLEAWLQRYGSA